MSTVLTHAVAACGIGAVFSPRLLPRNLWIPGMLCAMLPDADVAGFAFGVAYGDFWGHRGFTHSLCFAALVASVLTVAVFFARPHKPWLWLYLFLATAAHGMLDMLTDGGLGVAFFSPVSDGRFFLPARPLAVPPVGLGFFSSPRALAVLLSEALWIWLPSAALVAIGWWWYRDGPHREPAASQPPAT